MDTSLTHTHSVLQALNPKHLAEWQGSGIDDRLIAANLKSRSGNSPYDDLLYSDDLPRRNDGRLTDGFLRTYQHLENGGWWVNGINPITGDDRLFGQFKPDFPRTDKDGKVIKYEQPPKVCYEPIFLRIPDAIADKCAAKVGLSREWSEAQSDGLTFWEWIIARPQVPIFLTEGVKKAAALISQGKIAIALTSITTACLPKPKDLPDYVEHIPKLLPDLKQFATKNREVNIAFDQDEKLTTQKAVFLQTRKVGKLFKNDGCLVNAVIWNRELGKGIDDLIANNQDWETKVKTVKLLDYINVTQDKRLTYPVNESVNMRYLDGLTIPEGTRIIALKSAKGTGKTEWISNYIQSYLSMGFRVLLLSHRRQLSRQLCDRVGIDYIDEIVEGTSLTKGLYGYGLCVDSLHSKARKPFKLESWYNSAMPYIVLIDEVEQVLWHTLNANTEVKTNRTEVITNLNSLLKGSYQTILSDADLSNLSLNYARSAMTYQDEDSGNQVSPKIHLINNQYIPQAYNCMVFPDSDPSGLVQELKNHLASDKKVFVCLSSQKAKGIYSAQTLEKDLNRQFPDKKILRIDADTIADSTHPAYGIITRLNSVITQYDCVLATPVIETGVSIDTVYFDAVFGIFNGVQAPDTVRQSLIRVRDNVPRYIWIANKGLNKVGNGKTSYQELMESNKQLFGLHIKNLAASGLQDSIDGNFSTIALETYCKYAARINWGAAHYRTEVINGLRSEGQNIIMLDPTDKKDLKTYREQLKDVRDANYLEYCQKVADSETLTDSEFETLDKQQAKTEAERLQHRKGQLQRLYELPDVTPSLVKGDDSKLYPKLKLHYLLTLGREFLADRDRRVAQKQIEKDNGKVWLPDFNRSQYLAKIQTLEYLGITREMIDRLASAQWTKNSPELIAIADKAQSGRESLKTLLGITITEKMGVIQIIQTLLGMLGLKLPFLKKVGNGRKGKSERVRLYGPVQSIFESLLNFADTPSYLDGDMADGRVAIFEGWYLKDYENQVPNLPLLLAA